MTPHGASAAPSVVGSDAEELQGFHLDIRFLWAAIYRNRYFVIGILVASVIAGIVLTITATKIFSASASVQVDQQSSSIIQQSSSIEPRVEGQEVDRFLQTQVDIIRSRATAERVAEALSLHSNDRFVRGMGAEPATAPSGGRNLPNTRRDQIIDILRDNLSVDLPRTSRIITISFRSPDPALAQTIANQYADSYIMSNLRRRFDSSSYARDFLEDQLGIAKNRLEESERATINYARNAGLLDTSQGVANPAGQSGESGGIRSLTTSNLVQLNNALIAARAGRIAAEQRWRQAAGAPLMSLPEVQTNIAIQSLNQQRAAARAALAQAQQRYRDDHPTLQQASSQVEELDLQIARLAGATRDSLREQFEVAQGQEAALEQQVSNLRGSTLAEQGRSVQYNILKRETDTNRSMYDALLQRYKEISAQAGVTANNLAVLDRASQPTAPISPRPMVNLALALFAGILLSAVFVFIRERFVDAIRTPDEVTPKLGLPLLNVIPLLPTGIDSVTALGNRRSNFAEAYYALRTSLGLMSSNGQIRSLLITSGREQEGKSTTSYSLARAFSQIDVKVLLIDGDMRRPALHHLLGGSRENGLSTVLSQQRDLFDCIVPTDFDNLDFLAAGPIPPSPTELLSGRRLKDVITAASERYQLVIVDGPPVLGLADAPLYASAIEATLYIVASGRDRAGYGRDGLRRLVAGGGKVLGAVLTMFDPKQSGYGAEYGYYYAYGDAFEPGQAPPKQGR